MPTFDRQSWEDRWSQVIRQQPDEVARRPPSDHLVETAFDLAPGDALDAGCGHGSEALWLAGHGWRVTAVDFAATALSLARARAEQLGSDVAERIEWVEGDLGAWTPDADRYDLVSSLYVHVAGSVGEFVQRLARGVRPGGTLLLVGHRPVDPATGAATAAAGQQQVSVDDVLAALDATEWTVDVAEDRLRAVSGSGVDAVVRAYRGG